MYLKDLETTTDVFAQCKHFDIYFFSGTATLRSQIILFLFGITKEKIARTFHVCVFSERNRSYLCPINLTFATLSVVTERCHMDMRPFYIHIAGFNVLDIQVVLLNSY